MATRDVRNVLRVPGRLIMNPTDLSIDAPHGGTELGLVRDAEFRLGIKTSVVTAEEFGVQPIEYVYAGEAAVMAAVLREFDEDAIQAIFPDTAPGMCGPISTISYDVNDDPRAGRFLSAQSFSLLFSPRSLDRHPMILLYKVIPLVEESSLLNLSLSEELGIGVMFHCIPDASGRVYSIGHRGDLTL